jgi:RimJ/RimL family protein N-acetyltransferase
MLVKEKNMNSKEVFLRLLTRNDEALICRWLTSAFVLHYSFVISGPFSLPSDFATESYAKRYFDILLKDPKRKSFAIVYKKTHVGTIGLKEIDLSKAQAECFIEIGEKTARARGVAHKAMTELLNYAFAELMLEKLELDVLEFNFAALKLYTRLGFKSQAQNQTLWHYDEFGVFWRVIRMTLPVKNWSSS